MRLYAPPPRHEVQLAGLAWGSTLQEVLHQCDAGFGGQRPAEELRLGDEIRQLRRWILRTRRIAVLRSTQFRPELPRLREGHLLGRRLDRIRARPDDQLVDQLGRIGLGSKERSINVDRCGLVDIGGCGYLQTRSELVGHEWLPQRGEAARLGVGADPGEQ
jgi:hypothetical protein